MKKTFNLYGGTVELVFDPDATKNRYIANGTPVRGVTEVLRQVLNKPGLMMWPMNEAMKYLFGAKWSEAESKYVIDKKVWAARSAEDGQMTMEAAIKAHRKKGDTSKDIGTLVHAAVEEKLKNIPPVLPGVDSKEPSDIQLLKSYSAFGKWYEANSIEVVALEQPVYSQQLKYAGTLDNVLAIDGKGQVIGDIKTTEPSQYALRDNQGKWAGIYPENFMQLGAYSKAYREEGNEVDDLLIINCTKSGQLHELYASDLGLSVHDCEVAWTLGLKLDDWLKKIMRNSKEIKG